MQLGRFVITAALTSLGILGGELSARAEKPDRATIDAYLLHREAPAAKITLQEGGTTFFEYKETVPAKRLTRPVSEYEGVVTNISTQHGIVVHPRADEVLFEPAGDKINVTIRWVIHADPGARGGRVLLSPTVLERTGLANTKVQGKVSTQVAVLPTKATRAELALDFWGYRLYRNLAEDKMALLSKLGVSGLSIADNGKIPPLDRASRAVTLEVFEFERLRRRTWIAHRHLLAALNSKDPKIAAEAKLYISNLERPEGDISGLPVLTPEPPPAVAAQGNGKKGEGVTTLKPERVEPASGGGGTSGSGTLAPVSSYEPGTEGDDVLDESLPDDKPPPPKKAEPEPAKTPVVVAPEAGPSQETATDAKKDDDFLESQRQARETPIPSYPRGLVLDDPNIAYAAGVRVSYASIDLRGTSGKVPALFYYGQASITRALGVELTVPTTLVDIDVARAKTRYLMGNPLIGVKYRLHLPEVLGRKPALTLRTRWAIPISPLNTIPPTSLGAEEFSFPANFADTYAFLLEKTDIGFGASAAWQTKLIHVGFQLYGDYVFPVADSSDRTKFPTLGWGASVGVLPFGERVGVYAEGRSTSLLSGPGRTELFTYFGARGNFRRFEVAGWLCLPIGSIGSASGLQIGADLRFSYDIQDAVSYGHSGPRNRDRAFLE